MDPLTDLQAGAVHITLHSILDQVSEAITTTPVVMTTDRNRNRMYQQNPTYDQRNQNYQNRYDNNQDRYRFDNRRRPNKHQYHRNQPKAQITFKYTDQNLLEMMQTVRGFINFMKANPPDREQYKTNKIIKQREYGNEVNESDIHSSN